VRQKAHGKGRFPGKALPYGLCRAFPRKMHDKGFAMLPKHTVKSLFPVVRM
jgi:hypothetical protein